MINIQTTGQRKRRSDKLTSQERDDLLTYIESFPAVIDAAEAIGIHRNILDRVKYTGSASPETIQAIRQALEVWQRAQPKNGVSK